MLVTFTRDRHVRWKQSAEPFVEFAIDDQVNSVSRAAVFNPMGQTKINVPTLAGFQFKAVRIKKKLHIWIGCNRDVEAHLTIFKAEIVIAMFFDPRPCCQFQKSNRLQRTLKFAQDLAHIRTTFEDLSIRKRIFWCCSRIKLSGVTARGAQ